MIRTTINDESLKNSIAISGGLHLLALLFLYFGLPHLFTPLPVHHDAVPFEIVEVADITNTRIKEPEPQAKPPEPPPPKAESKPAQSQPQPKPPEKIEALNPEPKPQVKPPPPKPVEKPQTDAFAKMLKNLEADKKPQAPKAEEVKPDSKSTAQQTSSQAPALSDRLTISEEDLFRRQVEQHWNVPIGARDVENMVVEVRITVNPDKTVQSVDVVDKSRTFTDSYFRAMAESVVRAIWASSPLEVPDGKYQEWKVITSSFSAKDIL